MAQIGCLACHRWQDIRQLQHWIYGMQRIMSEITRSFLTSDESGQDPVLTSETTPDSGGALQANVTWGA